MTAERYACACLLRLSSSACALCCPMRSHSENFITPIVFTRMYKMVVWWGIFFINRRLILRGDYTSYFYVRGRQINSTMQRIRNVRHHSRIQLWFLASGNGNITFWKWSEWRSKHSARKYHQLRLSPSLLIVYNPRIPSPAPISGISPRLLREKPINSSLYSK